MGICPVTDGGEQQNFNAKAAKSAKKRKGRGRGDSGERGGGEKASTQRSRRTTEVAEKEPVGLALGPCAHERPARSHHLAPGLAHHQASPP